LLGLKQDGTAADPEHRATLLESIDELPAELQPALAVLLRCSRESASAQKDHPFWIATASSDLLDAMRRRHFRQELFYRLCAFPIHIAPLRQRRDDVLPLARSLLAALRSRTETPHGFPADDERELSPLSDYEFPGNIGELRAILAHAFLRQRATGGPLVLSIPGPESAARARSEAPRVREPDGLLHDVRHGKVLSAAQLQELERRNIVNALSQCSWKIAGDSGAARLLGMKPSTLAYQMKTLGIERPL
jgi:transcriptional regulator with GAF, ATPase, and Fis domain